GGVPEQPLMEDIELCRRLKALLKPQCPALVVTTSARRWERFGILSTILNMWLLRLRYCLGTSPEVLARRYYGHDAGV
ncbi:MAG: glycosyl transferase, partial [Pseudomonadota bacterium]